MTTVQTMLSSTLLRSTRAMLAAIFAWAIVLSTGCSPSRPELTPPDVLVAPYNTRDGEVLWAVVPLGNESGVGFVDTGMISDALVNRIDEVRGIACLPLNRTIAAMRAKNIRAVRSLADARALATTLGVDGLLVGSVTAYDPYNPPKLGLKLALYSRESSGGVMAFDPIKFQGAYTDFTKTQQSRYASRPLATISEYLDGSSHDVQFELRRYAVGRHEPDTALGWRRMLASMDLYTEFASQVVVSRLLEQERLRLAQPDADTQQASAANEQRTNARPSE